MMYQHDDGSWSCDPVTLDVAAHAAVALLIERAEVHEMWAESGSDPAWAVWS